MTPNFNNFVLQDIVVLDKVQLATFLLVSNRQCQENKRISSFQNNEQKAKRKRLARK